MAGGQAGLRFPSRDISHRSSLSFSSFSVPLFIYRIISTRIRHLDFHVRVLRARYEKGTRDVKMIYHLRLK